MTNTKQNTNVNEYFPTYLNSYHRLNKTGKTKWYDVDLSNGNIDDSLQNYLEYNNIIRVLQPQNIIIQKRETGNACSFRIALGKKNRERFIGRLSGDIKRVILIIKPSRKPYVEIFLCEVLKGDSYTFLKLLEGGELDTEIKFYRLKFTGNKPEIITPQPEQ